jgi:hypothetical protein
MAGHPAFAGSLLTRIGEDQQLTLAVTASTPKELHARVVAAIEEARACIRGNNERVLSTAEKVEEAQDIATARAIRAFCRVAGVACPPEFREIQPNGHDAQGEDAHADPARAVHAPADS